jgi:hypothetical protein
MNRQVALFAAIGCLAYLAALIATLPAPWVSRYIETKSRQVLVLREPTGNSWSGSGRLYMRLRSGALLELGELRWDARLGGILAGKLRVVLSLGDHAGTAEFELSPGSTAVRGVDLEIPGEFVASMAPAMEALGPKGKLTVRSENFRIDGDTLLGLADIGWRPVRLERAGGLELGSHVAHLRGAGNKVDFDLGTLEGALRLSGSGSWYPEGGLNISGMLEHGEDPSGALAPFLQGVCSEYRPGRCTFQFKR